MPTVVGILTFMSGINYYFLSCEPEFSTNFGYFNIYEQLKFYAQLSGISTFMSGINYYFLSCEPEFSTNFGYFNIYELLKFYAQLS